MQRLLHGRHLSHELWQVRRIKMPDHEIKQIEEMQQGVENPADRHEISFAVTGSVVLFRHLARVHGFVTSNQPR